VLLLDTSVIIAYYLPETFSRQVQTLYAQAYQPSITPLIELEVVSVLSGMVRTQSLAIDAARSSKLAFS
jgi:predicted nucleic acid-binding protein